MAKTVIESEIIKNLFDSLSYYNFYIKMYKGKMTKSTFYKRKSQIIKFLIINGEKLNINVTIRHLDKNDKNEIFYPIELEYDGKLLKVHQKEADYIKNLLPDNIKILPYKKSNNILEEYDENKMIEAEDCIRKFYLRYCNIDKVTVDQIPIIIFLEKNFGNDFVFRPNLRYQGDLIAYKRNGNKKAGFSFLTFKKKDITKAYKVLYNENLQYI